MQIKLVIAVTSIFKSFNGRFDFSPAPATF